MPMLGFRAMTFFDGALVIDSSGDVAVVAIAALLVVAAVCAWGLAVVVAARAVWSWARRWRARRIESRRAER